MAAHKSFPPPKGGIDLLAICVSCRRQEKAAAQLQGNTTTGLPKQCFKKHGMRLYRRDISWQCLHFLICPMQSYPSARHGHICILHAAAAYCLQMLVSSDAKCHDHLSLCIAFKCLCPAMQNAMTTFHCVLPSNACVLRCQMP